MPQNNNFDINSDSLVSVFSHGVMVSAGKGGSNTEVIAAYYDSKPETSGLYIIVPSGDIKYFDSTPQDFSSQGQIFAFNSKQGAFLLRPFNEDDGIWVSKYKIPVPADSLEEKVVNDSAVAIGQLLGVPAPEVEPFEEQLLAYVDETSKTLIDLIYISYSAYARVASDWQQINLDEDLYNNATAYEIESNKASDLINKFDAADGYLTISDVETASVPVSDNQ